jgi:hypothetical protein
MKGYLVNNENCKLLDIVEGQNDFLIPTFNVIKSEHVEKFIPNRLIDKTSIEEVEFQESSVVREKDSSYSVKEIVKTANYMKNEWRGINIKGDSEFYKILARVFSDRKNDFYI